MRRLRALIPFARRARSGGGTLAGCAPTSGGVGRRGLLGLIAAAPVALPAAVRAATAPEPYSEMVFFDSDGAYAGSLARYHAELDTWADALDGVTRAGGLTSPVVRPLSPAPIVPGPAQPPAPFDQAAVPAGRVAAFIDDVGSGP